MARPVRIAVLGADGRMGRALVRAVLGAAPRAVLAAASERPGHASVGKDAGVVAGGERDGRARSPASCPTGASPTSGSTSPPPA